MFQILWFNTFFQNLAARKALDIDGFSNTRLHELASVPAQPFTPQFNLCLLSGLFPQT
jgi:hypothetical protein